MTHEDRIKNLEKFLKDAFCIDGECKYRSTDVILSKDTSEINQDTTFVLTDSKRGSFLISMSPEYKKP
jgi:hypothetical protein